jgi:excisionase family DNA binding protein
MGTRDEVAALKRFHRLARTGRLTELREELGLSQTDVADCLDVTPSAVSRWESAKTRPRRKTAVRLLELLEVELLATAVLLSIALASLADRVLTVPEAAKLCRISPRSYYSAVRRGELPGLKVGRRVLVPGCQLARLLAGEGVIATNTGNTTPLG